MSAIIAIVLKRKLNSKGTSFRADHPPPFEVRSTQPWAPPHAPCASALITPKLARSSSPEPTTKTYGHRLPDARVGGDRRDSLCGAEHAASAVRRRRVVLLVIERRRRLGGRSGGAQAIPTFALALTLALVLHPPFSSRWDPRPTSPRSESSWALTVSAMARTTRCWAGFTSACLHAPHRTRHAVALSTRRRRGYKIFEAAACGVVGKRD